MAKKIKSKQKIVKVKFTDYEELEKLFKRIEKIWYPYFGKECPEFYPNCPQCKFVLIYNKFKQEVFDEVLK